MEIIYQWLHTKTDIQLCLDRYEHKKGNDHVFLTTVVLGALAKKKEIDEKITEYLQDRSLSEVTKVEYAILLLSSYEMMFQYDVPYKVVLNEGINLAKQYGAEDSHKFINSVLDCIAKDVRGMECG